MGYGRIEMRKTLLYVVAAVLLGVLVVATPLVAFFGSKVSQGEVERGLPVPMKGEYEEVQDYSRVSHPENIEQLGLLVGVASAFAFAVFFYAKIHLLK